MAVVTLHTVRHGRKVVGQLFANDGKKYRLSVVCLRCGKASVIRYDSFLLYGCRCRGYGLNNRALCFV